MDSKHLKRGERTCLQRVQMALARLWASSGLSSSSGTTVTKSWAAPASVLEKLKTKTSDPAAASPAAAAAALEGGGSGGLQLLLDFNAFDAQVPVEVEEGVFLCGRPVGEADDRAVGQLHQELCGGELDDHLEGTEEAEGDVQDPKKGATKYTRYCVDSQGSALTLNSSPCWNGKPPSRTSSHHLPPR